MMTSQGASLRLLKRRRRRTAGLAGMAAAVVADMRKSSNSVKEAVLF
jgi:hypothetical protein